jgi:hypothetical protein
MPYDTDEVLSQMPYDTDEVSPTTPTSLVRSPTTPTDLFRSMPYIGVDGLPFVPTPFMEPTETFTTPLRKRESIENLLDRQQTGCKKPKKNVTIDDQVVLID